MQCRSCHQGPFKETTAASELSRARHQAACTGGCGACVQGLCTNRAWHHSRAMGHLQQSTEYLRAVSCRTCPQEPLLSTGSPGHAGRSLYRQWRVCRQGARAQAVPHLSCSMCSIISQVQQASSQQEADTCSAPSGGLPQLCPKALCAVEVNAVPAECWLPGS